MPITKNLLGYNFDESWNFDDSINFDSYSLSTTDMSMEVDVEFGMIHNFASDVDLVMTVNLEYLGVTAIDLLPLIPSKFHTSDMMRDYISVVSLGIGSALDSITGLQDLIDPYLVGRDYMGNLASLIGLKFIGEDTASTDNLRRQLLEAISFFKIKGTYKALELIGKLSGYTTNIYDMYTNDYSTFVLEDWFVADYEEENPAGLDSSYYKSPHFGYEVLLDTLYGSDSDSYLWTNSMLSTIPEAVELVRPINTVPHIWTRLDAITKEDGLVYTIDATQVNTTVTDNWQYLREYFDESWNFDNGINFDQDLSGFLASITKFKVGTGHIGQLPTYSGFILETEVYEGSITGYTVSVDGILFEMSIPIAESHIGLSELVLCLNDDSVVIASTFPYTDKTEGAEMKIFVEVRP